MDEEEILALSVQLIIDGKPEEAVELLSKLYKIKTPRIVVGLPSKCRKAYGCYNNKTQTIYLKSSEEYKNPFIILHEYYHHLRSRHGKHRGTEKHADQYALKAIEAWHRWRNR